MIFRQRTVAQKKIDIAAPANRLCGDCSDENPDGLRRRGGQSKQG